MYALVFSLESQNARWRQAEWGLLEFVYCLLLDNCAYQEFRYTTSTFPIMHLICPLKFCISIVFNFSWERCNTQEKWKTKVMQNFGGQIRCIMRNVEVVYTCSTGDSVSLKRSRAFHAWCKFRQNHKLALLAALRPHASRELFFTNKWCSVLINHHCKTSFRLVGDGLFTRWKVGLVFDPRLYDLQLLVLEIFHFAF